MTIGTKPDVCLRAYYLVNAPYNGLLCIGTIRDIGVSHFFVRVPYPLFFGFDFRGLDREAFGDAGAASAGP